MGFRTIRWLFGGAVRRPGERIYAIGDVHGQYRLLRHLLDEVASHLLETGTGRPTVILLGDLIDRGPDSSEVLRFLRGVQRSTGRLIVLAGNHEELMLRAYDGVPGAMRYWIDHGGGATLRSFGIDVDEAPSDTRTLHARMVDAIPPDLIGWVRGLPLSWQSGNYFFCHAGVRPGVPLHRQNREDLLWIRKPFLDHAGDHGRIVVHGHTEVADVDRRENRIAIDTAAYRSGVLTALCLDHDRMEVVSTAGMARDLSPAVEWAAMRSTEPSEVLVPG